MFKNREEAGEALADKLIDQKGKKPLVLAIPRGAVPLAKIITERLEGEMDVVLVHKFSHPMHLEFALGSVTEEGDIFINEGARSLGISDEELQSSAQFEIGQLREKRRKWASHLIPLDPYDRLVIVVDDGIATGATARAAIRYLKHKGAKRIIVASPVTANGAVQVLLNEGAEVCSPLTPRDFLSVSQFYKDFSEVTDEDVIRILSQVKRSKPSEVFKKGVNYGSRKQKKIHLQTKETGRAH